MSKTAMVEVKDKQLFTREQFDEPRNFTELLSACEILVASKILPKEIDTKEKAAVVILTGRELGLRMMASTRGIYVVNGKPSLSAQMMLSLAHNTKELEDYEVIETGSAETAKCTVTVTRKGKKPYTCSFSVDEAKKMGKYQNEWLKQPETMCRSRAISKNLRVTFPDAILGMYTPEEVATIQDDEPRLTMRKPQAREVAPEAVIVEEPPVVEEQPKVEEVHVDQPPTDERPMPPGFKVMAAKFNGICRSKTCGQEIKEGMEMAHSKDKGNFHLDCVPSA